MHPTSWTVQHYYPETEIIKGKVWTGKSLEVHFWNGLRVGEDWYHIDLSWQQFPAGSIVQEFAVLERQELNDSEAIRLRCALLLNRVDDCLKA
ncbi:YunG family protein [Duganella margarita]|uniref:YunG family protein n=1 Tax=Duganella margarita TaxID=2692170 RepID=UPI003FCE1782